MSAYATTIRYIRSKGASYAAAAFGAKPRPKEHKTRRVRRKVV